MLRIRHETNLVIRCAEWLVSNQTTNSVIIGRPLINSIGCSKEQMLATAADRNNGVFDVCNDPSDSTMQLVLATI